MCQVTGLHNWGMQEPLACPTCVRQSLKAHIFLVLPREDLRKGQKHGDLGWYAINFSNLVQIRNHQHREMSPNEYLFILMEICIKVHHSKPYILVIQILNLAIRPQNKNKQTQV